MSSTVTSTSPSATSTSTDTGSDNSLIDPSSLLFGFLVTVLSLFGVFMITGLVWHRLAMRRRALDAATRVGPTGQRVVQLVKPVLWDSWVANADGCAKWADAKPLAAQALELPHEKFTQPLPVPRSVAFRRWLIRKTPPEVYYLFHPPRAPTIVTPTSINASQVDLPPAGAHVQVSMLIAMPRPPEDRYNGAGVDADDEERSLPEMVVGTTQLPYYSTSSTLSLSHHQGP